MKHPKRLAKRTAALLLCVVLLSLHIPYIPQASAAGAILPFILPAIPELSGLFFMADMYGRNSTLEDLNRREGFRGNLPGTQIDALDRELERMRMSKRMAEESGYDEREVAEALAIMAAAGLSYDAPDWEAEYIAGFTHPTKPYEPTEPVWGEVGLMTKYGNDKWASAWGEAIIPGAGLIGVVNDPAGAYITTSVVSKVTAWLAGLFGNAAPGPQTLPAMNYLQTLTAMDFVKTGQQINITARSYGLSDIYIAPASVTSYKDNHGQYMYFHAVDGNLTRIDARQYNGSNLAPPGGGGTYGISAEYVRMGLAINPAKIGQGNMSGFASSFDMLVYTFQVNEAGYVTAELSNLAVESATLGLPAVPLVNNAGAVAGTIPDDLPDRGLYIPVPAIPSTDTGEIDWPGYLGGLKTYNPTKAIEDAQTGETEAEKEGEKEKDKEAEKEDTDNPAIADSKYDWSRLRDKWAGLVNIFPFCLPFDVIGIFTAFTAEPQMIEPIEVNILPFLPGNTGMIRVDFNIPGLDALVKIFRTGMLLLFVFGLIMATRGLITW